jgi:antitoxin VapB
MSNEYRAKVFKSGNSVALRLPKGLGIKEGTEMVVREEHSKFTFEPVDAPKRKFNIAKVAGSATNLEYIKDADRVFEERPLRWDDPADEPAAK